MARNLKSVERRTTVDLVFDYLYDEIVSMRLLPGAKISEVEIAGLFSVSRQPVRDAFSRLEHLDLLLIRPQKATEVKRFSIMAITKARFVRAALEAEVLRRAASLCDKKSARQLEKQIVDQTSAVKESDYPSFRLLDYEFHESLCQMAKTDFAFDVISENKAKVDRLCVLGLAARSEELDQLLDDHITIAKMVTSNDAQGAVDAGMVHLSRLDATIEGIRNKHAEYFDD